MRKFKIGIVGLGAIGTVLGTVLLRKDPQTVLIGRSDQMGRILLENGVKVSGEISGCHPVQNFCSRIEDLQHFDLDLVFISTKTWALPQVLDELTGVFNPGMRIVSTHNGLGTEDLIAERFGANAAFRMNLNFGVSLKGPGEAHVAFFNRPNHIGAVSAINRTVAEDIAELFTDAGLETAFADDIRLTVWKKMVMKCTMAAICAVTDKTIREALHFPPTREIAEACFEEMLAVAEAKGYHLGKAYLKQAVAYLEEAGIHKDSMCADIENRRPTEIDFLGAKVVSYARETGVPVPVVSAMTNLVKALESNYLGSR